VEQAEFERARQMFTDQVRTRFGPEAPIASVELQQYGDVPEIEPGELFGKIFIAVPEGADPDDLTVRREASVAFARAYRAELAELRKEFGVTSFGVGLTEVNFPSTTQASSRGPVAHMKLKADRVRALLAPGGDQPVTAVMARLGREDLETLDTLIAAGIAPSRAEAVRWALARIRERPAYAQLRARSREIEDLKSRF
jgi:hypothetical protein